MAFTKIAAAGIGSTGTVTLENLVVTGSITASLTGTATTTTNIPNLTGAITSNNTTTSLGSFSSANLSTALSDKTGSGSNVFATSPTLTTVTVSSGGINVTGVSTLGNTVIGGGTTQLVVTGNARITGILTIGTSSITLDGSNNQLNVGTGVTLHHTNGVQVGGNTLHSTGLTLNSLTATGVSTFTNGPILVGTTTSTGTASQPLQVTGGAYVSGNLGIGTTNPTAKLQVVGSTDLNKLNLSGISSSISSTAVDVFVYDTRKDSDGGAWRKRTQNTSWYNETLNTATRGSRKDFPAVAVIVSTLTTVTIYDGDDPDMPMWMVFLGSEGGMSSQRMVQYINQQGYYLHALNGILVIGQKTNNDNYGSPIIRFISEYVNRMDPNTGSEGGVWNGTIADRNNTSGYRVSSTETYAIVNSIINDVAMTVLPNAPIDPSTGLPIPTIIVGTNGDGTYLSSIITEQGTVYNIGTDGGYTCTSVSIGSDKSLTMVRSDGTVYVWNDISKISASGTAADTTLSGLLGTVSGAQSV